MVKVAVILENPNQVEKLNEYFEKGFDIYQTFPIKNTYMFILNKYEPEPNNTERVVYASQNTSPARLGNY